MYRFQASETTVSTQTVMRQTFSGLQMHSVQYLVTPAVQVGRDPHHVDNTRGACCHTQHAYFTSITCTSHMSHASHVHRMHVTHVTHVTPLSHTQSHACHMNHIYTPYTVLCLSVHKWPLLCCGVQREARAHFGCPTLPGLEIENQGGTATAGSHWEKRITEVGVWVCGMGGVCMCITQLCCLSHRMKL